MQKFSKILGIVCLVFFVNIFYWLNTRFALALVSGNVFVDDVVYSNCIGDNQVYGYPSNSDDYTMSTGCLEWQGNPNYHYSDYGIGTWRLIEVKNINNFDCSNDETLLRPLTYSECLNSIYYVDNSILTILENPPSISYLSINPASTSDIMASTKSVFNDIWQIIALSMGIPTAFFAIKGILSIYKR
jgi:hypothetical protein